MTKINWNKPIQCIGRYTREWRDCKFMGIVEYGIKANTRYNRIVNTVNGLYYFDENGLWVDAIGDEDCHLRNTPERKPYTVITFKIGAGVFGSAVLLGAGLSNAVVGKDYNGKEIVHVSEFELAQ